MAKAIVAWLIMSGGALAAECASFEACLSEANAVLKTNASVVPEPVCYDPNQRLQVCLNINGTIQYLDRSIFARSPDGGPNWVLVRRDKPFAMQPTELAMTMFQIDAARGATVAVRFFYDPSQNSGDKRLLFSLKSNASGRAPIGVGVGADGYYLRKQGSSPGKPSQFETYWVPLWDPVLPTQAGWVALFATFQADGKVLIEAVNLSESTGSSRLRSSLIDAGWPLVEFPTLAQQKSFVDSADRFTIGAIDKLTGLAEPQPGFSQALVFDAPLTRGQRASVAISYFGAAIDRNAPFPKNFTPCNTGQVFSSQAPDDAFVQTLCGRLQSPSPLSFSDLVPGVRDLYAVGRAGTLWRRREKNDFVFQHIGSDDPIPDEQWRVIALRSNDASVYRNNNYYAFQSCKDGLFLTNAKAGIVMTDRYPTSDNGYHPSQAWFVALDLETGFGGRSVFISALDGRQIVAAPGADLGYSLPELADPTLGTWYGVPQLATCSSQGAERKSAR